MFEILATIQIPKGSGIGVLIYGLLGGIYNLVGNYGFAVILFTLALRLIVLPMDFGNKYFTKKNAAKTAEFRDEDAALKQQFAADPMKYMTARREMWRRNGYNPMGSSLFMIVNLVLTLFIFFTVFSCLGQVSTVNLNYQYEQLAVVYNEHEQDGTLETTDFRAQLNSAYTENNSSFLWVHNIFRPDTWAQKYPTFEEFKKATTDVALPLASDATAEQKENYRSEMYDTIIANLDAKNKNGWNGFFLLVIASAVTMYFSTAVNMAAMQKKKAADATKPVEVGYSVRHTRENQPDNAIPTIDPAQMGKIMKWVLPVIMVIVTFSSNAAFALYISAGAIIQTSLGFGVNALVDMILKKQEARAKADAPEHPIINPHSRYFKKRYEK